MKLFGELVPFETAQDIIERYTLPVEHTQGLGIDAALGRVLAEDIIALHYTPPFNRAGMDGYAVISGDTTSASKQNPEKLKLVDTLYAGSIPTVKLSAGECIQIATGTQMPVGADAVVMVEYTERQGDEVSIFKPVSSLDNVGLKGEDIKKGDVVLKHSVCLDAGKIGVLASQGLRLIKVYQRPVVAILPTGEEIVEIGKKLKPGQIYGINSHTLSAVVKESGGLPVIFPITRDNIESIKTNLAKALDEADIVVTSGGSSVGEKDLIINILEEWGKVLLHGRKIKSGKPTTFAVVRGKPVLGMPGYPTSCLMNAYLFLGPAIRRMAHLPPKRNIEVDAKLGERVTGSVSRKQFLPVKIEGDIAQPIFKKSRAITGTAKADGYIIIAENTSIMEKDEPVMVTLF